ncbi:N-alpha-acetyltransferase 20 isoform X10 [Cygnus olor]|uniref:N-alpha-acetyltransferase 20 isoform X10 n=1 Tax=Cygnus olor TaxID=8869 RepID=UPI001ADE94CA|nr:N-alpha-acetyltransferase 20 isoform X10 [Cygnus olor]
MLRPLNGLTKGFCGHNVYYVHDVPFVPFGGAKWYMSPRQAMRELILPGLHFGGRSSSPPLGPLRGLLPSEGGAPATPRKAAAGVLQPRVFQEKEQPDCPSCPGSCASVCLVPMAGVDDRSRAPKLLVLMLDVPLGKGPHPVCSAFLPYRVEKSSFQRDGEGINYTSASSCETRRRNKDTGSLDRRR